MTYKINDIELTLQPASGRWSLSSPLGVTGDGHFIYPAINQFEMRWGAMDIDEFNQIFNFYEQQGITGTVVASLPKLDASSYTFYDYSGCTLQRPEVGEYFTQYVQDVILVVSNIKT